MGYKPTTVHIAAMVDKLDEGNLRAVYMVVKQIYELQQAQAENNIKFS